MTYFSSYPLEKYVQIVIYPTHFSILNKMNEKQNNALVVFQNKKIRRIWYKDEWYFSVIDIVDVLTDSTIPRRYWVDLKTTLKEQGLELYDRIVRLKLASSDKKEYKIRFRCPAVLSHRV